MKQSQSMPARNLSFAKRIVLSFGAMVLVAVVCIFLIWYFGLPMLGVAGAADQRLAQVQHTLEQTVGHQRIVIVTELEQRRGDAVVIAENREILEQLQQRSSSLQPEVERQFRLLRSAYPGAFKALHWVDARSHSILASSQPDQVGCAFDNEALLQRALQPGVEELVEQSVAAGAAVVLIARPVRLGKSASSGGSVAILLVVLDAAALVESGLRATYDGSAASSATLVYGLGGEVFSRYPATARDDAVFRPGARLGGDFEGPQILPDAQRGEWLAVYRHLRLSPGLDWTLVHYQSKAEAMRELSQSVRIMAGVALLLSALGLLVIAVAAGRLTLPLKRLAQSAVQLGGGDLSARSHSKATESREIVELSEAFNTMAESVEKNQSVLEARVQERTVALVQQRDTAQRYLDIARVMLIALDRNGRITLVNRKAEEVLGHPEQDLLNLDWFDNFLPSVERLAGRRAFDALMDGDKAGLDRFENHIVPANGQVRVVAWSNTVLRDDLGRPAGTLSSGEDITQRQQAEARLKLAASVFTYAREGITITDANGCIIEVNDTFTQVTGYSREEVLGQNPRILRSGRQEPEFYTQMWTELQSKGYWSGEIWNRRKNGEVYAELLAISVVHDAQGKTQNYVALFTDITVMKDHQRELEHIAHFDALTGMPNRVLLADRLSQALLQSQRRHKNLAVAFLDLDGFKSVNDHHGHDVGDRLLITLAQRMKAALREGDTLARIGGDEFVAVLVDLEESSACEPILRRLLQAAAEPVEIDAAVLQVSASVGVTLHPQDGSDADLLMRHADQAMYQAKQAGKNRFHFFDIAHDAASKTLRESLQHIRAALQRDEFVLYYQPKVNMRTGVVVGAEALIRWQHPERGLLAPGLFLPVIEDDPLSVEVGEWVIEAALKQMLRWKAQGLDLQVSINIGAHQLQLGNFARRLAELLARYPDIAPNRLELEILETSALQDIAQVSEVMRACQALGVGFALDDFGTGYSSLTYLKRLPAELLKIDQSFVRDMLTDTDNRAIVQGVIGLAKAFGRQVIAEGVETTDLGLPLLRMGCELAQGYGVARAMPGAQIPAWVASWRPDPRWSDSAASGS
jgi:diguanylate cyclase (GGDEF)-like protein/PAS domain S-box-containing protein